MADKKPQKGKKKSGPGRPAYEPDDKTRGKVEMMVAFGMSQKLIAKELGIHHTTLINYYRDELDHGKAKANFSVIKTLYKMATGDPGDPKRGIPPTPPIPACTMFWAKTQCGFRETNRTEITGADGAPIQVEGRSRFDEEKLKSMPAKERLKLLETVRSLKKQDAES